MQTETQQLQATAEGLAESFRRFAGLAIDTAELLERIAKYPRISDAGDLAGHLDTLAEWHRDIHDTAAALVDGIEADRLDGFEPVDVCPDCMAVAANGAGETSAEHLDRYTAAAERWAADYGDGTGLVAECPDVYGECRNDDGECTSGERFSRQACDWCGDTLAGHRIHAAIARPE